MGIGNTDRYARELLYEAARLLSIRCPRCAQAKLRRIARHDVETTGADYEEALRKREDELKDLEWKGHTGTQILVTPRGKEAFRLMWDYSG